MAGRCLADRWQIEVLMIRWEGGEWSGVEYCRIKEGKGGGGSWGGWVARFFLEV